MSDKEPDNTEISLINSIASENLRDMVMDGAEIALDAVMHEGILKEIPFFGFWMKTYGTVTAVREQLFFKKVYGFLRELSDVPSEERQKFVKNLGDEREQRKVGEAIILLIDRLDNMSKPTVLGKLYRACIQGRINRNDFLRISTMVERVYYDDLNYLVSKYKTDMASAGVTLDMITVDFTFLSRDTTQDESLANVGLLKTKVDNVVQSGKHERVPIVRYQTSKYGILLVQNALLDEQRP